MIRFAGKFQIWNCYLSSKQRTVELQKKTYLEAQSILSAKDLLNIMHTLQMVCGLLLTYQQDWPELNTTGRKPST